MTARSAAADAPVYRTLTSQLAEDLNWLEDHCCQQSSLQQPASQLRYAAALVRNLIGPFLDGQPAEPLHVAVVGGAGAGKSTIANFLCGAVVAEANPQAGYTRHPTAYVAAGASVNWPAHVGFLGLLKRLSDPAPGNLDADVYQVRRVPLDGSTATLLPRFVVWDCPDMTTWAASGYIPRLLEIAGLADVLVYVASDERYNDAIPTQFLEMFAKSGKPVVVCLTKMREADAPALVEDFRKEVLARLSSDRIPCLTVPGLTAAELADPIRRAGRFQTPLLEQVSSLASPASAARQRSVRAAATWLVTHQQELLDVARRDLEALKTWRGLVLQGQEEFDQRYRREYLMSETFRRFDEALVKLLELLELPGIGQVLGTVLYIVRAPYRWIKGLFSRAMQKSQPPAIPERPVLEQALQAWLDLLHKEAAHRDEQHSLWRHIKSGFEENLIPGVRSRFEQGLTTFHQSLADETERTARAIYEDLQNNPLALNTLRGTKFALEVGAITGTLIAGGLNIWDVVLVPLAASVTQHLVELLGKQYVDRQREAARSRQMALVTQHLSGPLAEWLIQWPASGGSRFERLQLALSRVPEALQQMENAVTKALEKK